MSECREKLLPILRQLENLSGLALMVEQELDRRFGFQQPPGQRLSDEELHLIAETVSRLTYQAYEQLERLS